MTVVTPQALPPPPPTVCLYKLVFFYDYWSFAHKVSFGAFQHKIVNLFKQNKVKHFSEKNVLFNKNVSSWLSYIYSILAVIY